MRILSFEAEDFARLKVVAIRPDGRLVEIAGKNRQGKTSVLSAIWVALAGLRGGPIEPIRDGAERARIKITLGDAHPELIVTRTFKTAENDKGYTSTLRVESGEGAVFSNGQEVLSALLGAIAFDPSLFLKADDEDRLAMMRPLAPKGVDFDALKADRKAHFDARTTANRVAKERRAQAEAVILPPGAVPAMVDLAALEAEFASSAEFNTTIQRRHAGREAAKRDIDRLIEEEAEISARLDACIKAREDLEEKFANAEAIPPEKDILALRESLSKARSGNEVAAKAAERNRLNTEATAQENEAKRLTDLIEDIDTEMADAVARAVGNVPGLAFQNERIELNGHAFNMASDAEQLEAAIQIAALLNPTLRVVRVRDGSKLDEDALARLDALASKMDVQLWVETVGHAGPTGFELVDGEIAGAAPAAPAPAPAATDEEAV